MPKGKQSRNARVVEDKSGTWSSASQDYVRLAGLLYSHSLQAARSSDGNCSVYTLAGIPVLFSALRCLLIECNGRMYRHRSGGDAVLSDLIGNRSEVAVFTDHYPVPHELRERLEVLHEIRHEIVHPAHRPSGDFGNTPAYLAVVREAGLLQSTGAEPDYDWPAQLHSHRLFRWAFETIRLIAGIIVDEERLPTFMGEGLKASYSRYEAFDAA